MQDYDFFDIAGLPFDPPEKAAKKVKAAVEKAEKTLGGSLGSETQQSRRDEINSRISLIAKIKGEVFSAEGKLLPRYEELANERTEAAKKDLEARVRLAKRTKTELVVTNGAIREQRLKTKLSKESVEEVYKKYGFEILEIDPLAALPKFPTNSEKTFKDLADLRRSKDPNPNGADLTLATDLYAFVAYIQNEPENAIEYMSMDSKKIVTILDGYCKANSTRNDNLGKLCVSIATAAKSYVFNSEENRKAYGLFLLYKSPDLTELFSIIKDTNKSDLKDPSFADECIREIVKVFGNSEIALALYNSEAGLKDDPYIPSGKSFILKCSYCQNLCEFSSLNEAQNTNKCRHCGKELFKKCVKCSKLILVGLDSCPECGFVFANVGLFSKYLGMAESALRNGNIDEARNMLLKAKMADPSEQTKTVALESKIDAEERKYAEPLNKLHAFIARKEYEAASSYMATLIVRYPNLNLADQERQIRTVLENCQRQFAGIQSKDRVSKINGCLDVLSICADYASAVSYLKSERPILDGSINSSTNDISGNIVVNWSGTRERGVTYCLVRKPGKIAPSNVFDGEVIVDNYNGLSYSDDKVAAGVWYSYSVFAKRMDAISAPMSTSAIVLLKVSDIKFTQNGNSIRLFWNAPKRCDGDKVTCLCDGKQRIVAENANGSVEEKNLEYNKRYIYFFKAIYRNGGKSESSQLSVLLTMVVGDFRISLKPVKNNVYALSWTIRQKGINIQIFSNDKLVQNSISDSNECQLEFPANGFFNVYTKAYSGGEWVKSLNEIEVNTYAPWDIDPKNSVLSEETISSPNNIVSKVKLSLKMSNGLPPNVVGLVYFVRSKTKSNSPAPWASPEEIRTSTDSIRVEIGTYLQSKEIIYTTTAKNEETYYVTMFAVYRVGGRDVYSSPSRRKFNRPLSADLFWKVTKSLIGGKKLVVNIKPNRPFVRRPHLILCASTTGKHLLSTRDNASKVVLDLPERFYESPQTVCTETFEIKANLEKNQKVFLFEENEVSNEQFILRWDDGFEGKIK